MDNTYDQTPVQPAADPAPVSQPAAQPWMQTKNASQPYAQPMDPRQLEVGRHIKRIKHARGSLLTLVILSFFNLLLLAVDQLGVSWPYCISMPWELTYLFKAFENNFVDGSWTNGPISYLFLSLSVVVLGVYLLCWILSKKKGSWLTAAAILYTVDSVLLLPYVLIAMESPLPYLLEFGFHILALVELYMGVMGQKKLKAMQQPSPQFQQANPVYYTGTCDPEKF